MAIFGRSFLRAPEGWVTLTSYLTLYSFNSEDELTAVERLSVPAGSIAFHPAQSEKCEKSVLLEPMLATLGRESIHQIANLLLNDLGFKWHKDAGSSHVPVVLRNFILEDQVVSKRVPGELCQQPVVLMCVPAVMGKDQVGGNRLQPLEGFLHFGTFERHKAIGESP